MKWKTRKKSLSKAVYIGLTLSLLLGGLPAAPPVAHAATATPGGVDASGLRLWLKADAGNVTLDGDSVTKWKDSSPKGNDYVNDGTVAAIASRPKPKYVTANESLNFQPTVKFTRGSNGSILQDVDGLFAEGEVVNNASLYTITGGSPAMANSSVFNQPLASGSLGAFIPHITGAEAGKGNVLWDVGATSTRLTASNIVTPNDYNLWGMHFDANPTVGSNVYQSITRDGKQEAKGTQPRSPMTGKGNTAASLGSAVGGGSGYEGNMGELILFTNPLTAIQKRQVETYLAIKFGMTLKEGDYLSAGPSPQVVWNASANNGFNNNIAGIGVDQVGALNQTESRSSQKDTAQQVIITAKQALSDKQYMIWGDNGSISEGIPYGSSYKRLARTWKVQNTGSVSTVQVAVPASMIPLGGVLLTSDNSNFGNAAVAPMVEATLHGASYYVAEAALANGSYFTFAEKQPDVQLSKLEIWNGAQNVLSGFLPSKTIGYESAVPQEVDKVKIVAEANNGVNVKLTLSNYLQVDTTITDPTQVPIVPGLNTLKFELSNGSSNNVYKVDIFRQLAVGTDGRIQLNAGSVTASSFQPNTNYVPANVIDGNWEDPESRWSASGQGQWLQFDMGQLRAITYLQIAFLNALERQSTFEILESNDPNFATSTVLLAKRKSRSLQSTDSVFQPYVLDKPSTARYLRFVGYGNTAAGSSGNWNSLTELAMYTGTPPVIVEPEEPKGPPQAGDVAEGPPPALEVINVSTAEQLQAALDQAKPGIEIRLKTGTYEQNGPFVIKDKQGTVALPIRITAAEQGGAIIKGNSYLHVENSNYVEVSGLVFNSGIGTIGLDYRGIDASLAAEFRGEDSKSTTVPKGQIPYGQVHPGLELYNSSNISVLRNKFALDETGQPYRFSAPNGVGAVWCLTNIEGSCRIGDGDRYIADRPVYMGDTPFTNASLLTDNGTTRHFIRVEGISSHNRIAYNDIGAKKGFGATITYNGKAGYNISEYDVIEYNYFHDIGPRVTNGLEAIRLGLSGLSLASGHVTIQHNLFDGLNGEDEIISVKSSDNIVRYNTIRNSYGGIVARHGHRNSFYGNFILGDGKTPGFSGFRIYGNGHKIYNNYMEGLTTNVIRLDGGTHDGGPDGGTNPTVKWLEGTTEKTAVLNTLPVDQQTEILRGHWRQYNVEIFNNTMVNVGNNTSSYSFGGRNYQPVGTKVYNNVVFSNAGVMFNETSAAQNAPENERQVYVGNLVEGTANPTNITNAARVPASAIEKKPLYLVRSADGLVRLSANSPAIDASKAPYLPQDDMDGQTRYNMPDAGADEYDRQTAPTNKPLTAADVGPNAGHTVVEEGEAGLSALTLDSGKELVPSFHSNVAYYQVTVPAKLSSLKVIPTAISSGSQITISVDGGAKLPVTSGQPSEAIAIAKAGTVIMVEVSLPSGKSKSYTIAVQREEDGTPVTGTPIDSIRLGQDTYNLKVSSAQTAAVYAIYQESTRLLSGASFYTANPEIAAVNSQGMLTGVSKGTTVLVATYNQYNAKATVVVTEDQVEGEAGLSGLTINPIVALSPAFNPNTTMYQAVIPYNASRLTLLPTAIESRSYITVSVDGANQQTIPSGQSTTVDLTQGGGTITIEVSLPTGKSKVYTLTIQRGNTPPVTGTPIDSIRLGQDTYNLKVSNAQIAVVYAVYQESARLLPGASFYTANPEIATVNSQGMLTGVLKGTTVLVATYNQFNAKATVVVTDDKVEGEAGLSGLTINPIVALSPAFNPNTMIYQAVIPYNVNLITLLPTALETGSIIAVSVNGANRQTVLSGQACTLELVPGGSTITIDVSLPSGKNKTYTVTMQRTGSSGNRGSGGSSSGSYDDGGSSTASPAPGGGTTTVPTDTGAAHPGIPTPITGLTLNDIASHWAGSTIVKAAQLGIINGYPDGSFKPDEPMTRLQFAALLVRALKVPTGTEKISFTDQADIPDWALSELASAVQAGIIQGYEDDTLRPNKEISRAEMITMLARALKLDNKANTASPAFDDASVIPDWAKASISYAISAGLVQGKEGNRFVPNDIATRAEAVTIIIRMLERNK